MRTVMRPGDDGVKSYPLLNSLVVPRPIAWVSTVSGEGVGNLAPHSFFTVVCADPPMVAFSSVGEKDTVRNVRETREFVVNVATERLKHAVNNSSARFDPADDEAAELGLTMEDSDTVRPQRVAASPASIECVMHTMLQLGDSTLIIGRVTAFAIDPDILDGDHPTFEGLAPMSRLGINEWGMPPEVIRLDRPGPPSDIHQFD
ncbi:flavin reductase family protein [Allobranchiibius sp. GilTou38]|uniref:flavin reductase family protein n=1 Tax=Allobranchiibius sp. GilTou38 TaxID=2815210 RepID=UPI001AA0E6AC|nr:flavin reductase family protein [Allobranchiibius sp. GilTou38]MBO1767044.1 flavin reductase family protein [Allobranchiibius sp. GilTou38]